MILLNAQETADYLKVTKRTIYNWRTRGKIGGSKLGGLKFDKQYLDNLIQKSTKTDGLHNKEKQ